MKDEINETETEKGNISMHAAVETPVRFARDDLALMPVSKFNVDNVDDN